jgi:aryl-alcohol dehydrogenase-like predicted oxidoreductase
MKYKTLGNTGLFVSELCLETMTFDGKGVWANMGRGHLYVRCRSGRAPSIATARTWS